MFHRNSKQAQLALTLFAAFGILLAAAGCARTGAPLSQAKHFDNAQPVVTSIKNVNAAGPSAAAVRLQGLKAKHQGRILHNSAFSDLTAAPAVSGEVTLSKNVILGRVFLYGADLQYSSIGDADSMYLQSMAIGHLSTSFQVVGDRLQLIADQRSQFESDVNHPAQLVAEFPILSQTPDSVTIAIRTASTAVVEITGASKAAVRNTWVRSVNFVADGNYLMIESSVELADGQIAEFMESVFPRETLVPHEVKPLLDDHDREPLSERYRFLSNGSVYLDLAEGRAKTKVASRFDLSVTPIINWYITPNVPAQYLPMIKAGVEGWNRYSQKMWNRDMMKFQGVLPAGVKLGDPRYNVINWDSVPDATAAYETSASDITTGVTSHSMIYLPYSWVKIGKEYWATDSLTQEPDSANKVQSLMQARTLLGRKLPMNCIQDTAMAASLDARRSPDVFANELLKQVLFHEVGHSLGLGHNFKGSLAQDPTKPGAAFSTSIMDYNQYQLEDLAFDGENASTGPLLEYDRQIISALYNKSADVSSIDPVVPACDDADADDVAAGIDPFCIRYDAGSDPSDDLVRTIALVKDPKATLQRSRSLPVALLETLTVLPDPRTVSTGSDVQAALDKLFGQLKGVAGYYYVSGAQSISYLMKTNVRLLYTYRGENLLGGIPETDVRGRAANSLLYVTSLQHLETPVKDALTQVSLEAAKWLQATGYFQGAPASVEEAKAKELLANVDSVGSVVETAGLTKLRTAVLGDIKRLPTSPFYFSGDTSPAVDYEKLALSVLSDALTQPLTHQSGSAMRPIEERTQAVKSLLTFADTEAGAAAIAQAQTQIGLEISSAKNAVEREKLRALLKAFKPAAPAPDAKK